MQARRLNLGNKEEMAIILELLYAVGTSGGLVTITTLLVAQGFSWSDV